MAHRIISSDVRNPKKKTRGCTHPNREDVGNSFTKAWHTTEMYQVSLLWATGSIIVQFVAKDIGYNQPFVFTYIGSGVMTLFVPSFLGLSLLGLAHNPPIRDRSGMCCLPQHQPVCRHRRRCGLGKGLGCLLDCAELLCGDFC